MTTIKIVLYERLNQKAGVAGTDNPASLRADILNILRSPENTVEIDFLGMRSLSPSFAYEAFGKLVDDLGETVIKRLNFNNDTLDLKQRIQDAISRRKNVIQAQAS